MRIIKPYGRSQSGFGNDGRHRREVIAYRDLSTSISVTDFVYNDSKLVIAQWISAVDKIATKPFDGSPPTTEQRNFRQALGNAVLNIIKEKDLLPDPFNRRKRLERQWWLRVHPYGENTDDAAHRNPKGRWYVRFADADMVLDNDPSEIAEKLYQHLCLNEYRLHSAAPLKRAGKIDARAESIATSVLAPPSTTRLEGLYWTEEDRFHYGSSGNVATEILETAAALERNGKRVTKKSVAARLHQHYGRMFKDENGSIKTISEARIAHPGLYALHEAIKKFYARLVVARKKNSITDTMPKTMDALFHLVERKAINQQLNALIRLGKVIHYEAASVHSLDTPEDIFASWQADVSTSRFWTSQGQSEIKRNEAFVRIWRGIISLATRTLTAWGDPERKISGDILGTRQTHQALAQFDESAFDRKAILLFGKRAEFLSRQETDTKRAVLEAALLGVRHLRHASFHFKGRGGFMTALTQGISTDNSCSMEFVQFLWQRDVEQRILKIHKTMRAAHFEYLFNSQEYEAISAAITATDNSQLPLPRLRRVLLRAETAWHLPKFNLDLPAPGNRLQMQNPVKHCQYVALKFLYERAFPTWLSGLTSEELNKLIQIAVTRTTNEARKINQDDKANARANGLIKLQPGENFHSFFDRISALIATEFRVQKGYTEDPAKARQNSRYLDNLSCDIVAQAFKDYLYTKGFKFLLDMTATRRGIPETKAFDLGDIPLSIQEDAIDDWQLILYFLLHLIPVDEVNKLTHQVVKWTLLEELNAPEGTATLRVMGLYQEMHDASFEALTDLPYEHSLKMLFENEYLLDKIYPSTLNDTDSSASNTPRGLREMMRFGDQHALKSIFDANRISSHQVDALVGSDGTEDTGPRKAQEIREQLHREWVRSGKKLSAQEKSAYCEALTTLVRHRHLSANVYLKNHVRLHRLLMRVLGRLVDYSGLWERDLYFVALALMYARGSTPLSVFNTDDGRYKLGTGQIVAALRTLGTLPDQQTLRQSFIKYFGSDVTNRSTGRAVRSRNHFAHFNMLQDRGAPLNLTRSVNLARVLMSYDRKLRNAISKSIIDLLAKDGLLLSWEMRERKLTNASVRSVQVTHLEDSRLTENLCSPDYVRMVAALFGGTAFTE